MWHSRPVSTPPPFMANAILNFHFDFLNPSLTLNNMTTIFNHYYPQTLESAYRKYILPDYEYDKNLWILLELKRIEMEIYAYGSHFAQTSLQFSFLQTIQVIVKRDILNTFRKEENLYTFSKCFIFERIERMNGGCLQLKHCHKRGK